MKALTLWQPWASLVALGVKTIETRSWSTSYRGPLAIHAAKRPVRAGDRVGDYLAVKDADYTDDTPPFLVRWPEREPLDPSEKWRWMPLGEVVATSALAACVPTEKIRWGEADGWRDGRTVLVLSERHRPYGDFSPGRFAWLLADIEPLDEPVPAKGRQGLWEWTPSTLALAR